MRTVPNLLGVFLIFLTILSGCQSDTDNPDCQRAEPIKGPQVSVKITRIERELFPMRSKAQFVNVLQKYPALADALLEHSNISRKAMKDEDNRKLDSILINDLYKAAAAPETDTIFRACEKNFGDLKDVEQQFSEAFTRMKQYYPDFKIPKIYTYALGYKKQLYANDSVIVIGLDYFLHPHNPYTLPSAVMPQYMLRRFRRETIAPLTILYLSDKYNVSDPLDNTMMKEMMSWGKAWHFVKTMLPCVHDSLIIGYDSPQYKSIQENEKFVWAFFTEHNLFFETDHTLVGRYVGERPFIQEIGQNCPGRVAQWLGWKIVRKYMHDSNTPLPALMKEKNAKKIFEAAKYRPAS